MVNNSVTFFTLTDHLNVQIILINGVNFFDMNRKLFN